MTPDSLRVLWRGANADEQRPFAVMEKQGVACACCGCRLTSIAAIAVARFEATYRAVCVPFCSDCATSESRILENAWREIERNERGRF
jgi:hypothetical protein